VDFHRALDVYVEESDFPGVLDPLDFAFWSSIVVLVDGCVFNHFVLCDSLFEVFFCDELILNSVLFRRALVSSCERDAELEFAREVFEQLSNIRAFTNSRRSTY
jgi:hypothetical protein